MPAPNAPMADHFVVLRHQEGDAWDYAVIQHLGQKSEVTAAPTPPNPVPDLRAWHNDTFVSGPSWAEFTKAMGMGGSANTAPAVHTVYNSWQDFATDRAGAATSNAGGWADIRQHSDSHREIADRIFPK